MKKISLLIVPFFLFLSCKNNNSNDSIEKWKQEIRESEQDFATMVQDEGIHNAFVAFAADDAVMMRNNALFKGKMAIEEFYKNANSKTLTWTPDFIEISNSGDLGYTYGTYHYSYKDSLGNEQVDIGIFHTVWKRQQDGTWKFVWD